MGYEGLSKTMAQFNTTDAESANNNKILVEDTASCNFHCPAYTVTNTTRYLSLPRLAGVTERDNAN
jgi:hypothetical protein